MKIGMMSIRKLIGRMAFDEETLIGTTFDLPANSMVSFEAPSASGFRTALSRFTQVALSKDILAFKVTSSVRPLS